MYFKPCPLFLILTSQLLISSNKQGKQVMMEGWRENGSVGDRSNCPTLEKIVQNSFDRG